ncbi:hypothetical protein ABT301_33975 [Streptomyces sp. NPDC000987]|uniref:hypothetical protein n=1 Tax=Streptomyces sp. NPDC000987 TaxID=3154374 RepID=UPI0033229D9C
MSGAVMAVPLGGFGGFGGDDARGEQRVDVLVVWPSSASTSLLCSPMSGAGRRTSAGLRLKRNGNPGVVTVPSVGSS